MGSGWIAISTGRSRSRMGTLWRRIAPGMRFFDWAALERTRVWGAGDAREVVGRGGGGFSVRGGFG